MSIALVYPIRDVSSNIDDQLLKYSLRSVEAYGHNVERLFILGRRRPWFSDRIQMCSIDEHCTDSKFANVTAKLRTFCEAEIPFVLMNDDFIMLKDYDFAQPQWYVDGTLKNLRAKHTSDVYKEMIDRTMQIFKIKGSEPNYMTHTPFMVPAPALFTAFVGQYVKKARRVYSYSFRQVYGSGAKVMKGGLIECKDVKIRNKHNFAQWREMLEKEWMISASPNSTDGNLLAALDMKYPEKSIWEK